MDKPHGSPHSRPVNPGEKAPGPGKGTTALGKPTGSRRATGLDEVPRATRGPQARQREAPPATTKAHGQVPSNSGHRVPLTWTARTTRNEPQHRNRCQATPAAAQPPGRKTSPRRLRNSRRLDGRVRAQQHTQLLPATKEPPSGWTCACPDGTERLPARKSRHPDGQLCAPQQPPAHK